jgi:sugar transferase (PEP-CTERM/EpsH1 system associated)
MVENKLRIVHLVRALDVGGLERVVLDLVTHRSEAVDARVLCLEHRGEIAQRFESAGVEVQVLSSGGSSAGRRIWSLTKTLRKLRPHVLHTHNAAPHLNGALAANLARVPVLVHTKHGRNYPKDRKLVLQNRIAARLSSKVVCVSHDAAEVARNIEKVSENRIAVIHNGINIGRFRMNPAPFKSLTCRAIHVARLNWVKDQATLLRAVRLVVDKLPGFELDVIGDGPARQEIVALQKELALEECVRFHGAREDVADWLARADLFVLSSVSEGICLTLLEAMAAGLPIVATDVGGNREVVDNGNTGTLVPPSDPDAMAKAILTMCTSAPVAREMGRRGRERVESHFDVRMMVARYETMYRELLDRALSTRPHSADSKRSQQVVPASLKT